MAKASFNATYSVSICVQFLGLSHCSRAGVLDPGEPADPNAPIVFEGYEDRRHLPNLAGVAGFAYI